MLAWDDEEERSGETPPFGTKPALCVGTRRLPGLPNPRMEQPPRSAGVAGRMLPRALPRPEAPARAWPSQREKPERRKGPALRGLSCAEEDSNLHPVILDQALNLARRVSNTSRSCRSVQIVQPRGQYGRNGRSGCCHGCCHGSVPAGPLGAVLAEARRAGSRWRTCWGGLVPTWQSERACIEPQALPDQAVATAKLSLVRLTL